MHAATFRMTSSMQQHSEWHQACISLTVASQCLNWATTIAFEQLDMHEDASWCILSRKEAILTNKKSQLISSDADFLQLAVHASTKFLQANNIQHMSREHPTNYKPETQLIFSSCSRIGTASASAVCRLQIRLLGVINCQALQINRISTRYQESWK
jgi:hypothetical protein